MLTTEARKNLLQKKWSFTRWDAEAGAGLPRHFLIEFLRQWAESRSAHWHNFALLIQIKCFRYAQTLKKLSTPPYRPVSFSKEWKANDFHQNKKINLSLWPYPLGITQSPKTITRVHPTCSIDYVYCWIALGDHKLFATGDRGLIFKSWCLRK